MQKPIQRVKFTKTIARHTKIRDQNPSLGLICSSEPHQRSPIAPKFENRSQEETEWQEQGAREAAWKLAKSVLQLKKKNRATLFSPSEKRCLPASTLKPEEQEFVVDSGASMHMIIKKDLSDAEMDTLTTSRSNDSGQGDGVPKAGCQQAAADSRGSRTCMCANTHCWTGWHTQGEKDELTSCSSTI